MSPARIHIYGCYSVSYALAKRQDSKQNLRGLPLNVSLLRQCGFTKVAITHPRTFAPMASPFYVTMSSCLRESHVSIHRLAT